MLILDFCRVSTRCSTRLEDRERLIKFIPLPFPFFFFVPRMESWRHPKIDKKKNRSIGNSLYEKTTRIFAIKNFTIEFSLPTHRTPKSDPFEIVASETLELNHVIEASYYA